MTLEYCLGLAPNKASSESSKDSILPPISSGDEEARGGEWLAVADGEQVSMLMKCN